MDLKKSKGGFEGEEGRERCCNLMIIFEIIILKNRFRRERLDKVPRKHYIRLLHK